MAKKQQMRRTDQGAHVRGAGEGCRPQRWIVGRGIRSRDPTKTKR